MRNKIVLQIPLSGFKTLTGVNQIGMKKHFLFFFVSLCLCGKSLSQESDYFKDDHLRYENHIYRPNIKTIILELDNHPLSDPIIELGSEQRLHLSFDDLDGESKDYSYKFFHCDPRWNLSPLDETEFLEGFYSEHITSYKPSFNTLQPYYHFNAVFPNSQMRFTKSGNYVLMVYENNDTDKPILTQRFQIVESHVKILPNIHRATIVDQRNTSQEIDFNITYNNYPIQSPFSELTVVLRQNNRWDNAVYDIKPLFMKQNELEYNYEDANVFNGGNEFRNFDIRTTKFQTQFVKKIELDSTNTFNIYLKDEESRSFKRYSIEDDINGRYLVKVYDGGDSETESDYVYVHFRLKSDDVMPNGNYYIYGALTNWSTEPLARLTYNYDEQAYEVKLYLKQGYYNYQYVFVEDGKKIPDETLIEGNHFETENEYSIMVYQQLPGSRYQRLIGYKKLSSKNIY